MAEEAHLELLNHKLQLQQVEAALELDKENEDLLKLKNDLEEVIRLTIELIGKPESSEEIKWNVGDMCMAMCSRDKLFYKAKILEFLGEAACVVNFCEYDTTDVCQVSLPLSILFVWLSMHGHRCFRCQRYIEACFTSRREGHRVILSTECSLRPPSSSRSVQLI
uniref:Survival of motor neuron-related-splicing factor 30 n=1 Tax=Schistocephalus solidus TaxID=70667 RepID=A0A0X3Q5X8_SCHSO